MSEHEGLEPHVILGQRVHGGFHADATYQSPRTLGRETALDPWAEALVGRGGEVFPADAGLLTGIRLPNAEQQKVLLRNGLGRSFWNALTITGKIEARGRLLAEMPFPGPPTGHRRGHLRDGDRPLGQGPARGPRTRRGWNPPTWGSAATT